MFWVIWIECFEKIISVDRTCVLDKVFSRIVIIVGYVSFPKSDDPFVQEAYTRFIDRYIGSIFLQGIGQSSPIEIVSCCIMSSLGVCQL